MTTRLGFVVRLRHESYWGDFEMPPLIAFVNRLASYWPGSKETKLGFDAAENRGRRRLARASTMTEDDELPHAKRRQLTSQARDIVRNYSIASWAIRKHLDFVSRFNFSSRTGGDFDTQLERLIARWSRPGNCEVTGRFSLFQLIRAIEARAVVDGDVFLLKLDNGMLQAIEGDRVLSPSGGNIGGWTHGVKCDEQGRAISYAVHKRGLLGSLSLEREVSAANMLQHGYFDRIDQVRGISPLSSGLNALVDTYESVDYALAKAKVSQLFALTFYRASQDSAVAAEEDSDSEAGGYKVDFGRGPTLLDLEAGDRAEVMESKNPSSEFQAFMQAMVSIALKALDVPLCFYDESIANFSGNRAAAQLYTESSKGKRNNLCYLLDEITRWKIASWVASGELSLPRGVSIDQLAWRWIAAGMPWWNPSQEVNADVQAVRSGFNTREDICQERRGRSFFDIADDLLSEQQYVQRIGLVLDDPLLMQAIGMANTNQGE